MAYQKIILTQSDDYIAIRSEYKFSINFTNISNFDGAVINVYKAFTKKDGTIAFEDLTDKVDGNGQQIVYSKPQDVTYQSGVKENWIVFKLLNASANTNIIATINIEYTILDTEDLSRKNIRTNIPLIETI